MATATSTGWDRFKNWALVLTTITTAVLFLFRLEERLSYSKNQATFGVEIAAESMSVPPQFERELQRLITESNELAKQIPRTDSNKKELSDFPRFLSTLKYDRLHRHIKLSITNTGQITAKSVDLQVGADGLAAIEPASDEMKLLEFKQRVPIGDMPAKATTIVDIWDGGALSTSYRREAIDICHEQDSQKVLLPARYSGVFDAYFSETGVFGFIALFLGAWIAMALTVTTLFYLWERMRHTTEATSVSKDAPRTEQPVSTDPTPLRPPAS